MTQFSETAILHRTPWRPPVASEASGIYITLEDGRKLIDGVGGAAVSCLGMGVQEVQDAVKKQVDKLAYVYNMQLSNEPAEELSRYLMESSEGVFSSCGFVCGGSEAMEAAVKLARQYYWETGQRRRTNFIARRLSFHGNTLGTLALAHHPVRRAPYEDLLNHDSFHHVSPAYYKRFANEGESEEEYVERLRSELEHKFQEVGGDTVVAFVAETVVGATSGVVPPPKGYFKAMKSVCQKYGALLILDEVMSGMGRMGTLHAWQSYGDGATPDIQACAKGLGGGYASIGAVLMTKQIENGVRSGTGYWQHGHTYQAHPLSCAAALAVQKIIRRDNLLENCRIQGEHLRQRLEAGLRSPDSIALPFTFDIRGSGGFWGIEFDITADNSLDFGGKRFGLLVQARCFEKGLVIMGMSGGADIDGTTGRGDHAMLAPPYNVTREEIDKIADIFVASVEDVLLEAIAKK